MKTTTNTNPRVTDLDPADAPMTLCRAFAGKELTVAEFDAAMHRFAASKSPEGGYAKLRGTFHLGDGHAIEFRIDVDHALSEGSTLAQRMMRVSKFWGSDKGQELVAAYGGDAEKLAKLYHDAAVAALEAVA